MLESDTRGAFLWVFSIAQRRIARESIMSIFAETVSEFRFAAEPRTQFTAINSRLWKHHDGMAILTSRNFCKSRTCEFQRQLAQSAAASLNANCGMNCRLNCRTESNSLQSAAISACQPGPSSVEFRRLCISSYLCEQRTQRALSLSLSLSAVPG